MLVSFCNYLEKVNVGSFLGCFFFFSKLFFILQNLFFFLVVQGIVYSIFSVFSRCFFIELYFYFLEMKLLSYKSVIIENRKIYFKFFDNVILSIQLVFFVFFLWFYFVCVCFVQFFVVSMYFTGYSLVCYLIFCGKYIIFVNDLVVLKEVIYFVYF